MVILKLLGYGGIGFLVMNEFIFLLFHPRTKWKNLLNAIFEILVMLVKPSTKFSSQILLLYQAH